MQMTHEGPARTKTPRAKRILLILIFGVVMFCAGIGGASLWDRFWEGGSSGRELENEWAAFELLARKLKAHIVTHDGYIPADPYGAFVDEGVVDSYYDFFIGGRPVMIPLRGLPVRLNPDLSKNARGVLLSMDVPHVRETWACYTDGAVEREVWRGCPLGELSSISKADIRWDVAFLDAGYPLWTSVQHRRDWIQAHRDTLVWDAQRRMYMPSKVE